MKKANLVLMAALAAAGVVGVTGTALWPSVAMAAESHQLSAKIIKPLKAAQDAMNAKDWDAAYAALQEAQAIEDKTPYEAYMVDDIGWYILVQKQEFAAAAKALEAAINSGFIAPPDLTPRLKALSQIEYQAKDYPKAAEYGSKYLAQAPTDTDIAVLVAQSYYLAKDYAATRDFVSKTTAGEQKPNEQLLLLGLRSSFELKDRATTMQSLESLVRYYPQEKYWDDLLTNVLYETKGDRELRALYRLMQQTHALNKPDEYSEMANVLMTGGYPNEAKQVLQAGLAAGAFSGDSKTRADADLARAQTATASDQKDLAGAAQAIAAAKTGNQVVSVGKLYFSFGDYAKAADAIKQGLAKGGVTDVDDANMLLGIAYARSDKPTDAKAAFAAVKDAKLVGIAHLWDLYVDTESTPAASSG